MLSRVLSSARLLPDAVDGATDLSLLDEALASSRSAALGWITDARDELERRSGVVDLDLVEQRPL